jgi:hypothetical protein
VVCFLTVLLLQSELWSFFNFLEFETMNANVPAVPVASSALAARLSKTQAPVSRSGNAGKSFLKFDFNTGEWYCGRDETDVTGDSVIINTASIGHGWILWSGGAPKKIVVPFDQELPEAMPAEGQNTPSEARVLAGGFVDSGDQFVFETNSLGGRNGVDAVITEVIDRAQQGEQVFLYPIATLVSASYTHKSHGRVIHTPTFKITAWADVNGVREDQGQLTHQDVIEPPVDENQAPTRRRRTV